MVVEASVLVVDDDRVFCESLVDHFEALGVRAAYVTTYGEAMAAPLSRYPVVILDNHLPDGSGLALVDAVGAIDVETRFIMVTGDPSYNHAVQAIRCRVTDYFAKPIELDALTLAVTQAVTRARPSPLQPASPAIVEAPGPQPGADSIRYARSDAPILITGETGTGKSRLARKLHDASHRASGPFVAVDCAALVESVMEAELFGSCRGAFTGAIDRPGLLALADGGTVFFDEIGELPLRLQAKLLSVLENHQLRPVGGSTWRPIDTRVIAATHVDLDAAVDSGRFRSDLLYRLDVGNIALAPLRQCPQQLETAVSRLLAELGGPRTPQLASGELDRLREHSWPGNYRELRNVLMRALLLHPTDRLRPSCCIRRRGSNHRTPPVELTLAELERRSVLAALEHHQGHRGRTAHALGISPATLRRKLQAWEESTGQFDRSDRSDRSELPIDTTSKW